MVSGRRAFLLGAAAAAVVSPVVAENAYVEGQPFTFKVSPGIECGGEIISEWRVSCKWVFPRNFNHSSIITIEPTEEELRNSVKWPEDQAILTG